MTRPGAHSESAGGLPCRICMDLILGWCNLGKVHVLLLAEHFRVGSGIGLLGMEAHTRRRNRLNVKVEQLNTATNTVTLSVIQSFGNCPKYIQVRMLANDGALAAVMLHPARSWSDHRLFPRFIPHASSMRLSVALR